MDVEEKTMVLITIPPEHNPALQAHQGGLYLFTQLEGDEAKANEQLFNAKNEKRNITLPGCRLAVCSIRMATIPLQDKFGRVVKDEQGREKLAQVYQHALRILPFSDFDPPDGLTMSFDLSGASWIFPRGSLERELEDQDKRVTSGLMKRSAERSDVVLASNVTKIDPSKLRA